mmetsp:Transcript_42251/g.119876  ORF Transcript_42251/g.119876 Transcript_42251/m.119876 type:complete len:200 (-) Transcript_42251:362-961(-)
MHVQETWTVARLRNSVDALRVSQSVRRSNTAHTHAPSHHTFTTNTQPTPHAPHPDDANNHSVLSRGDGYHTCLSVCRMVLARCGSNSSKRLYDVDSQETLLLATREAPLLLVAHQHITRFEEPQLPEDVLRHAHLDPLRHRLVQPQARRRTQRLTSRQLRKEEVTLAHVCEWRWGRVGLSVSAGEVVDRLAVVRHASCE